MTWKLRRKPSNTIPEIKAIKPIKPIRPVKPIAPIGFEYYWKEDK